MQGFKVQKSHFGFLDSLDYDALESYETKQGHLWELCLLNITALGLKFSLPLSSSVSPS